MRILGFNKRWPKLTLEVFTTFRFPRKDRDWEVGEKVQCVLHPRSKHREVLCNAEIIAKEPRWMRFFSTPSTPVGIPPVSDDEAEADGFSKSADGRGPREMMWCWLLGKYSPIRLCEEPMNKLTLKKVKP